MADVVQNAYQSAKWESRRELSRNQQPSGRQQFLLSDKPEERLLNDNPDTFPDKNSCTHSHLESVSAEFLKSLEIAETQVPARYIDFPASEARFVRILIHNTRDSVPPAVDALEIFSPDWKKKNKNLALASGGITAKASSHLSGHGPEKIIDGQYGNDNCWISSSAPPVWIQISFPQPEIIAQVILSRDRKGKFSDRIITDFEVQLSHDGKKWMTTARWNLAEKRLQKIEKHIDKSTDSGTGASLSEADRLADEMWGDSFKYEWLMDARLPKEPRFHMPVELMPGKSWDGFLRYSFLRERLSMSNIPDDDYLSPLLVDRPAFPGGKPYWGRIARLQPLDRVLVLFEEMIGRLENQGLDVSKERVRLVEFRQRASSEAGSQELYLEARQAKRDLFFRDPALAPIEQVLFAKRYPFLESHNYSEHLDGRKKQGGGIYILHIPRDDKGCFRPERARIEELFNGNEGIVREPVSDYDARTIYFAYRPAKPEVDGWSSYWHLHAIEADGTGLRKLTDGPFHDFDAVCLPDGGLAFHSTRCNVRFLCWRPSAYVLYRMDADGTNMKRLSFANLSEWKPSVMSDGRILWTRSEYQDKGADYGHTIWAIRPDGTHPELVFGNNTPHGYSQAHEVPGSNEIVATLMSHGGHEGPIALIDRSRNIYDTDALTSITPDIRPHYQMSRPHYNTFRDPYPVSKDHFLVAHNPHDHYHHHYALYVIDRYGNREMLYADPVISSMHPSPLYPRKRPPVFPGNINKEPEAKGSGQFIVQNVYIGLGPEVIPGQVKYLRISEEVPHTLDVLSCGQNRTDYPPFSDFYATPVNHVHGPPHSFLTRTGNAGLVPLITKKNWTERVEKIDSGLYRIIQGGGWPSFVAKASHGIVRVAEDGSANFLAPAGKVLYFQLLDSAYNEIQRMRSVIQLQPGEVRSCIGCHEDRQMSPLNHDVMALRHQAVKPDPEPWGKGPFSYEKTVQPILNRNCIRCHDGRSPALPLLTGTTDRNRVPASFRTFIQGGYVHFFDWDYGMRHFKAEPLSFGSLQSRLFTILEDSLHRSEVQLNENELRALKTWIDLNCPLWPDYMYRLDRPESFTIETPDK